MSPPKNYCENCAAADIYSQIDLTKSFLAAAEQNQDQTQVVHLQTIILVLQDRLEIATNGCKACLHQLRAQ
ncbi:TPA: hypothetical protein DD448_03760 [Candidatus Collierbacteria bacterium]|uniref:Uncharacterized protein n=1 Tax=Candidatus Collierbacteria bacterium RIFOXYA2_FULL_46_10 TaxID=1817726 RepID=A0A1F5F3Y4_9BACT|nr:MAG: hypothetical protein A2187_00560 [Candidatus Collierbacteria bacterium RIFOXYA1_FULL_46_24]OGD74343.1 MAG: hypothetical protein A2228_02300 [Candidatus Collierbacteria bacterium RIFOXYA2_FULL_46_10]HBD02593.1 hypothetical protein [Candidatus Collierbacteria bacterium]HBO11033.1 hypothetical protein [Candidatus Collierbacteria bacterium]